MRCRLFQILLMSDVGILQDCSRWLTDKGCSIRGTQFITNQAREELPIVDEQPKNDVHTAATKCNVRPEPSHSKPRRWKSMLIHQGWLTALYTQHLLDSQSIEFEICIFPREAISSHYYGREEIPWNGSQTESYFQHVKFKCHRQER